MSDNRTAFDYPSNTPVVDPTDGTATNPWQMFFSRASAIVSAAQQSGPTTARPTSQVWIGRQFWDKTLGKPVYVASVKPIVWKDAMGNIV